MCAAELNYPFSYAGLNTADSYCALKFNNSPPLKAVEM